MYLVVKIFLSAGIIALASELAKRFSLASSLLLALPFTSLLALVWTYLETRDAAKLAEMSWGVFWLVPPSLVFFPVFSVLLNRGLHFAWAILAGAFAALLTYFVYSKILAYFGITL